MWTLVFTRDHLLFRTKSYEPNIGVFSDDQTAIDRYIKMHNTAMNAGTSLEMPSDLPEEVSLQQFLNCDVADENL